jgi:hypothetical protein
LYLVVYKRSAKVFGRKQASLKAEDFGDVDLDRGRGVKK